MRLDVSPLSRAVRQLEDGLERSRSAPGDELVRDGVILRFEYTYELSQKMRRRRLALSEPSADTIDRLAFADLVRLGSERGLLRSGWDVWRRYREARGATSHIYDAAKSREVFVEIPAFLVDAQALAAELERRSAEGD